MSTALQTIRAEARAHRTVVIDAFRKDGSREAREIEPYSIRPGESDQRLMFYCLKRDDWRSLMLSNIVTAQPTGRPFIPRERIEL